MTVEQWASIGGALGVVPALQWLRRRLGKDLKADAEAHKINVETGDLIVTRLWAEIERLDRDLAAVRAELATVKETAADEKTTLEHENALLRGEVGRLTLRVEGLEGILNVGP